MQTVRVQLGDGGERGYDVVIGGGVMDDAASRITQALRGAKKLVVVVDEGLLAIPEARSRVDVAMGGVRACGLAACVCPCTATEQHKSLSHVEKLAQACLAFGLDRHDAILAIGGGITGDVAGFVAASFKRGLAWIHCPTTLLAMVDASVGGKTGVNLLDARGVLSKNMFGSFHQPAQVLIDPRWLETLPTRALRCGLAECLKHAMIARSVTGAPAGLSLSGFGDDAKDILAGRTRAATTIASNVALKARVVERDERETASDADGGRTLLNLGHTFAHVIEQHASDRFLHGEAVGLGLIAATATAAAMRLCTSAHIDTVRGLVGSMGLPTAWGMGTDERDRNALLADMLLDKKSQGGSLRLVLPYQDGSGSLGQAKVVRDPPRDAVLAGWATIA